MFKHEDFTLNADFSPTSDMVIQENFTIESPPFDIDISNIHIMPMIGVGMPGDLMVLSPQLEDTMDVATKFERPEFNPISPRGPPERKVFAGDMDFQVEISALDTNKKKYLYSNQLNRIYVDMKTDFPVSFRWSGGAPLPAFVRACVVFSDESQAEKRVERCTQHTHEASNADINQAIVKNVLHSSREIGTHGVHYCGRPDQPDSWYSVVVELGPTGGSHAYQFMCKNSCSSGINRRAIEVIFTLEDWNGNVYGRQTVGARVCACPRRDMLRDQDEAAGARGKRRAPSCAPPGAPPGAPPSAPDAPLTKKIKLETVGVDDTLITLPPLQIVGSRAVIAGLQTMLAMMEAAAEMRGNALYAPHVAALKDKIEELKRPH